MLISYSWITRVSVLVEPCGAPEIQGVQHIIISLPEKTLDGKR